MTNEPTQSTAEPIRIRIDPFGRVFQQSPPQNLGQLNTTGFAWPTGNHPIELELELPNHHCNVGGRDPRTGQPACLFCPRNLRSFRPEPDRLQTTCLALSDLGARIHLIRLGGLAEPFWKDLVFDVIDWLDVGGRTDPKICVTTNGVVLDSTAAARWQERVERSEIRFSLDAGSPKTYVRLRRIAEFNRVIANLDQYCRTRNPESHIAVLANHINLINLSEIDQMIQMTRDHFCHYLSLGLTEPVVPEMKPYCLNDENKNRFRDAKDQAIELSERLDVKTVFHGNWP